MIRYTVELVDGTRHDVRVLPIDVRLAEREFGKTIATIDKDPSIDEVAFMVWSAMRREGTTTATSLDAFFDVFADVDQVASKPRPTKRPASASN